MRLFTVPAFLAALTACMAEPAWVADCGCTGQQVCRIAVDGTASCSAIPAACSAAISEDTCDSAAVDAACASAVCQAETVSFGAQCYEDGDGVFKSIACDVEDVEDL
jgi:hypothetical protein